MQPDLHGKVALITGSGRRSGIGYAIATVLAQRGASIVITDWGRRAEPDPDFEATAWAEMESIRQELAENGRPHFAFRADITNPAEVDSLIEATETALAPIDILINNAGIFVVKPLLETSVAEWELSMKVNAFGTFLCSVRVAERMIQQGTAGRIVNMSSISGKEGWPHFGAYTASKFAVLGFTQTLARELGPHGINVNAVCPGLIATDMQAHSIAHLAQLRGVSPAAVDQAQLERVPLGRYGTPAEVAGVVAFLVSPDSAYMTGQALNISGGLMVSR
jgi:NAD(P)-dependent dehydrogenase (short-subunit alcohol dehydrogenase family)